MRRPGLWVANGQPNDTVQMYSWRPGAITCLYDYLRANDVFGYKAANPQVPVIVRFRHPRHWQRDPANTARQLGQEVIEAWEEIRPLDPYVYFANRLNMHYENGDPDPAHQARYNTPEFYQKYAVWVRTTADVIKNGVPEIKLVTPPFAFGFNEDGSPDFNGNPIKGWAGYDFLRETVRDYFDNILTFHGYWGYPAGGSVPDWLYGPELSTWYAFRWQRLLSLFKFRYNLDAKIIIDEAGSFGPSDPDFTEQLIYYGEHCLSDRRVIALTYSLWSNPARDPLYQLNSWVDHIPDLAGHLRRLADMADVAEQAGAEATDFNDSSDEWRPGQALVATPEGFEDSGVALPVDLLEPPPPPDLAARTIRVLFEDGRVETIPLEEYLRGVVPGEMPALWPMEALKAQAVAARSYAQYAVEHPRHAPQADICTTVHCQHYAPDKIHPNADAAVQATQGTVVLYRGQTVETVFSARCGGHTRNNEDVWRSGRPVSYLRGVPCPDKGEKHGHGVGFCQHGARVLAEQGKSADEILRHYYQGIDLGPAPESSEVRAQI